jgi:Protein of unknown function (DUF2887)
LSTVQSIAPLPPKAIEVKETAFRSDSVFLPPTSEGNIFFGEVQEARDNLLYEALLAEIGIFAYRGSFACVIGDRDSFKDWRAVVIFC